MGRLPNTGFNSAYSLCGQMWTEIFCPHRVFIISDAHFFASGSLWLPVQPIQSLVTPNDHKPAYQELEGYDAARLFERTANGIHLNTKALRELESAYEQQRKQEINNDLQELVDQYNDLTTQINETSDAAQKAELYAQRSEILDQIHDTADLAAQYEGSGTSTIVSVV